MLNGTRWPHLLIAGLLLLVVAACSSTPPASEEADTTSDSETTQGNITIQNPWVRMAVVTGSDSEEMAMDEEGMEHEGMDEEGMEHEGMDEEGMEHEGETAAGHGGSGNSAAYMVVANSGDSADAIVSAATDVAETVELHTVEEGDNGMMQMRPVERIEVPAGGEAELRPGGFHVMLIGLKQDLNEGDTVDLTLTLEQGGEIEISAPVRIAE